MRKATIRVSRRFFHEVVLQLVGHPVSVHLVQVLPQRIGETAAVQAPGMQLEEEVSKSRGCGVDRSLELIDGCEMRRVRQLLPEDSEPQSERRHLLERVVVDVLCDPFPFPFLRRDDTVKEEPALLVRRPEPIEAPLQFLARLRELVGLLPELGVLTPEEAVGRIFERFSPADVARSRGKGGVGLGLAIVAAIAQAHGGDCSVQTSTQGSTFSLELPGFEEGSAGGGEEWRGEGGEKRERDAFVQRSQAILSIRMPSRYWVEIPVDWNV